jgi:hypothetical protein
MPPLRTIDSAIITAIRGNHIPWCWFAKVQVASPVGTLRFTDHWSGTDQTQNLDGSSVVWTWADFFAAGVSQGITDPLSVSMISFANMAPTVDWTAWALSPGLRDTPVTIYVAWYDPATLAFANYYQSYDGQIGRGEYLNRANMALKPHNPSWSRKAPSATLGMLGASFLIPPKTATRYSTTGLQVR